MTVALRDTPVTPDVVAAHGRRTDEYDRIVELLGREPNFTELGVFSLMWSEHCGYKYSRALLSDLRAGQSDEEFDRTLGTAIDEIHSASVA